MWLWTDIFSEFSELLCTSREMSKQWCTNDMDQLSFCMFSHKHGPRMDQKQTRMLTIGFSEHTALCKFEKRLSRTFAFYLCESRLPRVFFYIIIVETTHLCTVLVLVLYGHTKMRFKPVKLRNFRRFCKSLKRPFFDGRWNPSKCLKN